MPQWARIVLVARGGPIQYLACGFNVVADETVQTTRPQQQRSIV